MRLERADSVPGISPSHTADLIITNYAWAVAVKFAFADIAAFLSISHSRAAFSPKTLRRISGVIFG